MPDQGNRPARRVPRMTRLTARQRDIARRHGAPDPPNGESRRRKARLAGWITSANRFVLAAVGAGIAGLITTAVIAIPHLVASSLNPPPLPVTIVGGASPGLKPSTSLLGGTLQDDGSGEACDLAGVYVVPGAIEVRGTVTTADVANLVSGAAFANETDGEYVLQAGSGQTAVLTGIHTVLQRRVAAAGRPATVVQVESGCAGDAAIRYKASIDLDASDLTPQLDLEDAATGTDTPVTDLSTVLTQDQPITLDFAATTAKFDVSWQLRFDYAVDGRPQSATLPTGGKQFQTDAVTPDDSWLTLTLDPDGSTWSAASATSAQKQAQDRSDAESSVANDYAALDSDEATLRTDLAALAPPPSIGTDLAATARAEQRVLDGVGKVGAGVTCSDASIVAAEEQIVAHDAQAWSVGASAVGDIGTMSSDSSLLTDDLRTLLQVEPGFDGDGAAPSPAQLRQALSTAAAATAKAAPRVNPLIASANADVATAYADATKAAEAAPDCTTPPPTPSPIPLVE